MTEPDLGPLFRASSSPRGQLDADAIIKRSRRRRLPRLVITTAVPIIAVVGLLGGGIYGLSHVVGVSSGSSAAGKVEAPAAGVAPTPERIKQNYSAGTSSCVLPLPFYGPTAKDVVTSSAFPANGSPHETGTVTVTNTGTSTVVGTASSPAIVVTDSGKIVAQTLVSDDAGHRIDLAPGQSTRLEAYLPPTWCPALPAAPHGSFDVYAYLQLRLANGTNETVTGPTSKLTIGN